MRQRKVKCLLGQSMTALVGGKLFTSDGISIALPIFNFLLKPIRSMKWPSSKLCHWTSSFMHSQVDYSTKTFMLPPLLGCLTSNNRIATERLWETQVAFQISLIVCLTAMLKVGIGSFWSIWYDIAGYRDTSAKGVLHLSTGEFMESGSTCIK